MDNCLQYVDHGKLHLNPGQERCIQIVPSKKCTIIEILWESEPRQPVMLTGKRAIAAQDTQYHGYECYFFNNGREETTVEVSFYIRIE
ncbi:hypothetical protein C1N83_28190 (plasmid) [Priestia aryabhattai]